ncbi:MAG: hypothetical protein ACYC2H_01260 [Thermoplasmatota archaeon]
MEKLGVVSVLVALGWALVQWLMRQLEKKDAAYLAMITVKDDEIRIITAAATKAQTENTDRIIAVIEGNQLVQRGVEKALAELTTTMRVQRQMP